MSKPKLVIRRSSDPIPQRNVHIVIHGEPGLGKTSLSFTFAKPVLHIDTTSGLERAVANIRADSIPLGPAYPFKDFFNWVLSSDFVTFINAEKYQSIAIDEIGTLLDSHMSPYVTSLDPSYRNSSGGLTLRGYGALGDTFRRLKDRIWSLGLDMISIAHSKEEGEGASKKMVLEIPGKSKSIVYATADQLGYLHFVGDQLTLDFTKGRFFDAKDTARIGEVKIPHYNDEAYKTIGENICKTVKEKMTEASRDQVELQAKVQEWREDMEGADKTESTEDRIEDIKTIDSRALQYCGRKI